MNDAQAAGTGGVIADRVFGNDTAKLMSLE
jgi:hypothetical protein